MQKKPDAVDYVSGVNQTIVRTIGFGCTAAMHNDKLDVIQAKALRITSGAMSSKPVATLLIETHE